MSSPSHNTPDELAAAPVSTILPRDMVLIDHTIDTPLDASGEASASPGQQIVSAPCISVQFELDVSMSPGQGITLSPGAVRQSFDARNLLRSRRCVLLRLLFLLQRILLLL